MRLAEAALQISAEDDAVGECALQSCVNWVDKHVKWKRLPFRAVRKMMRLVSVRFSPV
jgi:hypothetical protein